MKFSLRARKNNNRFVMIEKVSDSEVERVCGRENTKLGRVYAKANSVSDARVGSDGVSLHSKVKGGSTMPYLATASLNGGEVQSTTCSCVARKNCKHVAAMLLSWKRNLARPKASDNNESKSIKSTTKKPPPPPPVVVLPDDSPSSDFNADAEEDAKRGGSKKRATSDEDVSTPKRTKVIDVDKATSTASNKSVINRATSPAKSANAADAKRASPKQEQQLPVDFYNRAFASPTKPAILAPQSGYHTLESFSQLERDLRRAKAMLTFQRVVLGSLVSQYRQERDSLKVELEEALQRNNNGY
jgi:hypothetical protein